jgi:putative ABC transport system permease protein
MKPLDRKLLRDLMRTWGQALAIALVLASGVATLVLANGAYRSLLETRTAYYERYRFADVFATARRAPAHLKERIARIPGVLSAETRIQSIALLDIEGHNQPVTGLILSLPRSGKQPAVNALYLSAGRFPDPLHDSEVLINDSFAKAQHLRPGNTFRAILNGRMKTLHVVGTVFSPEFIYALGPGDIVPDDKRFGVIWLGETSAEAAFDLKGAFNSVTLKLMRGVNADIALERLDTLLAAYGGRGGYLRKDQQSHAFIDAELKQLRAMSRIIPPIFLAVAAFLINMTLARLIAMEREQIGLLKALGYSGFAVAIHYLKYVTVIAAAGVVIGIGSGIWLGRGLTRIYAEFYHFPFLVFINPPDVFIVAGAIGLLAAWLGSLQSISRVLALSPAVAMAPPVPPRYQHGIIERLGPLLRASQITMMVIRHLARHPLRTSMTILGISAACALLVMSLSTNDAVEQMIDITYFQTNRQHITIGFENLKPERVVQDVSRLPGVTRAEPVRNVAATLRNGHRSRRITIQAIRGDSDLQRLLNLKLEPISLPEFGLALSDKLARILKVRVGDRVEVETTDQRRRTFHLPVTAIQQSYLGLTAYVDYDAITALLGDGRAVTAVNISTDTNLSNTLYKKLKSLPSIASVMLMRASLKTFRDTLAQNIHVMMSVYVALATIITFGVVYNSARIQLSERARELASLRVLGFTSAEVSAILLGQIAFTVVFAIPIGFGIGYLFTYVLISGFETELYRVPLVVNRPTYGWTTVIVIVTSIVSALIVRRRVDQLDLISVLKSRE